jgi:hypothetical protein
MANRLNRFQMRVLECAINYAETRGWHVLPVSKNKKPLIKEWSKTASKDPKTIINWWREYPSANIGVLTGPESGFWVVDVDVKNDINGIQSLASYFGNRFQFDKEKYLLGASPSGGRHILFKWDDNYPVKSTSRILPGVDTRGAGGQIIVAPSARNVEGVWLEYRWNNWNLPVSPMTPWSHEIITMAGGKTGEKLDLDKIIRGLSEGERDEQLHKFAWLLKHRGISYELAVGFVMTAASRCVPPFDPEIAEQKVRNAYASTGGEEPLDSFVSRLLPE